jgi:4-amino-4-deoxy-L-arabinose transferase-like glycosyltransferase
MKKNIVLFVTLAIITFLLRIFYANHMYQDDGFWFMSAKEMLRGKILYSEIYFDKPPGLPLLYALLFKLFGSELITIRLFTIFYSLVISFVIYLFGSYLYDKRTGRLAALFFTIFSTTFTTGHVQGLNTDFLMVLPYTAAALLLVKPIKEGRLHRLTSLMGGVLVGIAFHINPKAIYNLLFFGLLLLIPIIWKRFSAKPFTIRDTIKLYVWTLTGFVLGTLPIFLFLYSTNSFDAYWQQVWVWGSLYSSYYSIWRIVKTGFLQTINYFSVNMIFFITLLFIAFNTFNGFRKSELGIQPATFESDKALLIWFISSYLGMSVGGRFFGHYFFQIIPALSLIGARGLFSIMAELKNQTLIMRRVVILILVIAFSISLVRFHSLTVALAIGHFTGRSNERVSKWFHNRLNRDEKMIVETIKASKNGTLFDEPLFVWGYRPELYYWSGMIPVSKYLSVQLLTGIPSDVHFDKDAKRRLLDESSLSVARKELASEINERRPEYIIDELGFYVSEQSIMAYTELQDVMKHYERIPSPSFPIYRRREIRRSN